MSNNRFQQARKTAPVRSLFAAALVIGCMFGTVTSAAAQASFPITPDTITPSPGNSAYLEGHAVGSQGYICLPTASGTNSWTVNAARPEATLLVDVFGHPVQIITHFTSIDTNPNDFAPKPVPLGGNATWQSSLDTSKVWQWLPEKSMPALTPAARTRARYLACCCSRSATRRGRRAAQFWLKQLSFSA